MLIRLRHKTAGAIMLALLTVMAASAAPEKGKPNVILVLIDDMGWADFSCFGNTEAKTPNIDRMAAEGMAFEQFYVNSPICSPSRVAFSTGQYPQRWQITSYLNNRKSNAERGVANWLDPKAPMLARSLHAAGYATGHFGKWHMGGQRDVTDAPPITDYGFDASLTNFEGMGAKLLPLTKTGNGKVGRIWEGAEILGTPFTWIQRSEITGGYVDAAIPFMDQAQKDSKPFYINLWPDDVHGPLWPPAEVYNAAKAKGSRAMYLAVLVQLDKQLGKLFDYIRSSDALRDNTLILICSDNGCAKGEGQAGILRGYKTHLYEGGIRSSLVVWGPGVMAPGTAGKRDTTSVFAAIDLAPSLQRLTGATPPADAVFDGEDVLDTLLGRMPASRQTPLFYGRPPDRKSFYGVENLPDLAMRNGKWKLLCDYDGGRPELYDIVADPGESKNLQAAHPELAAKMSSQVLDWFKAMPTPSGDGR